MDPPSMTSPLPAHHRQFDELGAHLAQQSGQRGVQFGVWAPHARTVAVVGDFNGWQPAPLSPAPGPLWAPETRLPPPRSRPPIPTPGRARRCSSCNPSAPPPLFRRPAIARRMRPRLQLRCAMPQPSLRNPQACLSPETAMGGRDDGARSISWNSVLWRKDGGPRRESRQHNRTMAR